MIFTSIPVTQIEAQNITDLSTGEMQTTATLICGPDIIGNVNINSSNTVNFSSAEAVIDIRCRLLEARWSIAADAADSAVLQINKAEETLLAYFNIIPTIHLELVEYNVKVHSENWRRDNIDDLS